MNWRHFLLASVVLTAPVAVHAATLQPESTWAVTRVGAKAPGASPYCALARRFENNIIMTFARNTRDETSVAIDFQQPVFQSDQSVQLNLDTGSGEDRQFLLKPASNKAVVARIGADARFFREMEANNGLNASVMGQNYTFAMRDMADANRQLDECLAGLQFENGREEAGMDDKIAALQDQIQTLKEQRSSMATGAENTNYSSQLQSAAGSENADLAKKISDLQMQNLSLRDNMESQRSAYDNLQTKTLEDKSRIALLEETQDQLRRAEEDTKKFRDELYTTQMRQDELLQKLDKYSTEQAKRQELEKHLEVVRAENEKLVASLKDEKDRLELVKSAQDAMLAEQQQELSKTKAELAQTSTQRDNLKSRLQEYAGIQDKLAALAGEQRELGNTVTALQTERKDLTDKLTAERARLEEIQKNKKDLEEQVNSGKAEKEKLAKLLDEEKAKQKDIEALEGNLNKLKEEQKQLAGKVEGLEGEKKSLQEQVVDLEARVKKVEEEKKKVSEDLAAANTEKAKISEDLASAKTEKEKISQDLASAKTEKAKISEDLASAKTEKEKALSDLAFVKTDKEKAVADLQVARTEKLDLVADLDEADQIATAQSETIDTLTVKQKGLMTQVASLEGEKKELIAQLDQQKTQLASLQSDSKTNRDTKFELDRIKEQMAELSKERDQMKLALQAEKDKNMQLAMEMAKSESDVRELYTQAEELEYQRVDLNSALEFERTKNLSETEPAAGDPALAEMKASLAAMQAERDEYKRLLDAERGRTKQLQDVAEAAGAKETVGEMSARIKKLETENVTLLRELEYEKTKNGDVTTASINTVGKGDQVTVTKLREEVKRLQARSQELETQQGALLAQVRMLEAEKQKMAQQQPVLNAAPQNDAEKVQLKAQIAALQSEKQTLAATLAQRDAAAKTAATTAVSAQNANAAVAQRAQNDAANAMREVEALRAQLQQAQTLLATRQAQAAAPVSTAYAAPVPVAEAGMKSAPVIDTKEPMASMAAPSRNIESDLRGLLQSANLGSMGSFGPVTLPVASDVQGWRWKIGKLTGNAESAPAVDAASQSAVIETFLAKAKSRCPGDFAVIENSRTQSARGLIVSTDIACVAGANGVAAAITFVQFGDRMVTIAHEAATADMAEAMAARDKIIQAAMASK